MNRIAFALMFLVLALPRSAQTQMMSKTEYRDYMKGLDVEAEQWQEQIGQIAVDKMNLDYAQGKGIADLRDVVVNKNLSLLRQFLELQLSHEILSSDLQIEYSLTDAASTLDTIADALPANQEGNYWRRTLRVIVAKMAELDLPLRKHVTAYATELEARADKCSR